MSNDSFNDDIDDGRTAKPGMSTGVKVLIGVLVGGGLLSLLCCGGFVYFGMNAVEIVNTPAEVEAMTQEIVKIQIPEGFNGVSGFKFEMFGVGMKMVAYTGPNEGSSILIMESKQPGGGSAEAQMEQFQNQMEQQGQGEGGEFQQEGLTDRESETRTLTVGGAPVEFTFAKGKGEQSGVETRQVSGVIEGKEGAVIIMIQIPEADYNEEEIVKMIESIQ